jgi:hypothetical protein
MPIALELGGPDGGRGGWLGGHAGGRRWRVVDRYGANRLTAVWRPVAAIKDADDPRCRPGCAWSEKPGPALAVELFADGLKGWLYLVVQSAR